MLGEAATRRYGPANRGHTRCTAEQRNTRRTEMCARPGAGRAGGGRGGGRLGEISILRSSTSHEDQKKGVESLPPKNDQKKKQHQPTSAIHLWNCEDLRVSDQKELKKKLFCVKSY